MDFYERIIIIHISFMKDLVTLRRHILFILSAVAIAAFAAVGVTAGAHRLWAHQSYKAKWPMRIILMLLQTTAFQVSILPMRTYSYTLRKTIFIHSRDHYLIDIVNTFNNYINNIGNIY